MSEVGWLKSKNIAPKFMLQGNHTGRQKVWDNKKQQQQKKAREKSESSEFLKSPQVMNSFLNQFGGAAIFQTSSCGSNNERKLIRWDLTSRCASITETSASPDDCIIFNIYAINVQFVSRKWREIITSNFRAIHYGPTNPCVRECVRALQTCKALINSRADCVWWSNNVAALHSGLFPLQGNKYDGGYRLWYFFKKDGGGGRVYQYAFIKITLLLWPRLTVCAGGVRPCPQGQNSRQTSN